MKLVKKSYVINNLKEFRGKNLNENEIQNREFQLIVLELH